MTGTRCRLLAVPAARRRLRRRHAPGQDGAALANGGHGGPGRRAGWRVRLGVWVGMVAATHGFAAPSAFDAANQLYFEGRFAEAAAAYERMIDAGRASGVVWYNLGNAWYKAGQPGRAIAAYLRARELNPRDPDLRFNLRFVREKVTGRDVRADPAWRRVLRALTLNEWSRLWAAVFWGWFVLLMLRELRPAWRKPLHTASALAGTATVLLAIALTAAWRLSRVPTAVVIRTEAVVRQGPLERSPVAFKLRDGSELVVQDQQEIVDQGRTQQWLRIQDAGGRMGWLRRDEVVVTQG